MPAELEAAIQKFEEVTVVQGEGDDRWGNPFTGTPVRVAKPGHIEEAVAAAEEAIRLAEETKVGSERMPGFLRNRASASV